MDHRLTFLSIVSDDGNGGGVVEEYYSISSPVTSSEIYESTEEEEDMDNCLIMLAQSNGRNKSKGSMADEKKQHVEDADQFNSEKNPAILALQVSNNSNKGNSHGNKDNKSHECSICGSEFSSGQAFGGHMRRHRTASAAASNQASIESRNGDGIEQTSVLLCDLNLPAPEDAFRDFNLENHSKLLFTPRQLW